MKFSSPLLRGKILKRYKRFFCEAQINEERITAHVANTGSMDTCWKIGWPVLLERNDNPRRKLKYSLHMAHNGKTWIGVNTMLTNQIAMEGITSGIISPLRGYHKIKREVKIENDRIDFLLEYANSLCYVEVKNVTLRRNDGFCLFPDAVSLRGQKHLKRLIRLKKQKHRAVMLFIVQREDVHTFTEAKEQDPVYANLLCEAKKAGVEIMVYQCSLSEEEITITRPLPFISSLQ